MGAVNEDDDDDEKSVEGVTFLRHLGRGQARYHMDEVMLMC